MSIKQHTSTGGRLEPAPSTVAARRARAQVLLGTGRATLAAVVGAWYAGDEAAARAEIYPPRSRATVATVAPWRDWDGQ